MSWNAFDAKWEQGYGLAVEYAAENGNLNVPVSYVTLGILLPPDPLSESISFW